MRRLTILPRRHPNISGIQLMDFYAARPRVCGRPLRFDKRIELSEEEVLGERDHIRTLVHNGLVSLLDESGTPCPEFLELPEYDPMQPPPAPEPPPESQAKAKPAEPALPKPAEPQEAEKAEAGSGDMLELPSLDEHEAAVGEEHDEFLERILPEHVARRIPKVERKRKGPAKADEPRG